MVQEWSRRKLREICNIIAGQAPSSKYYNEEGKGIPFLTVNSFGRIYPKIERWTKKCLKESKEGDVLFSVAGSLGLVNMGITACITRSIFALRPNQNLVLQKFLFYALKKYGSQIASLGSGTAQKVITINQISEFEIPLPPLPIQQKIVKILDTIQEAIDIHDNIIEKTNELKKSLMNLLFHYGLAGLRVKELASSRVSELTSSEIETLGLKLKQTEIGEIPEDWEVVRLGEIAEVVRGGSPRPKGDPRYFSKKPTGIHWITIADITKYKIGQYIVNTDEYVTKEAIKKSRYLEKGTLVLTNSGTVGIPAILGINGCIHDGLLALLNLRRTDLMYLYYYFDFTKQIFQQIAPKGTQANLNTIIVGNFKIPLPPLPEQQEIAEILQTVDQKIDIERRKKELYEELFKTMLNKIMNQEIDINLLNY
jgi:type I restriction enzyme S subunit